MCILVMAKELGLFEKIRSICGVIKRSFAGKVRNKVLTGELNDACLFGMPFLVYTGIGGRRDRVMKIAMILIIMGRPLPCQISFAPC
jgi:nitrate/nitrite transport system substrate-binding protein